MKSIIINEVKSLINKEGLLFKLETLAKNLRISKKTLYKYFSSKEEMIKLIIKESHLDVKKQQKAIFDLDTDLLDKIKRLLKVIPINSELFTDDNLRNLNIYYPDLYNLVINFFKTDWETTFELLDRAKEQSLIKDIDNGLFKELYLCGCFYNYSHKTNYQERLENLINVIFEGIEK